MLPGEEALVFGQFIFSGFSKPAADPSVAEKRQQRKQDKDTAIGVNRRPSIFRPACHRKYSR